LSLPQYFELSDAWRDVCAELRRALGDSAFDIWIAPLEPVALDGACLLLSAPAGTQAWVSKRFGPILDRCAQSVLGAAGKVLFDAPGTQRSTPESRLQTPAPPSLNPRYNFGQFIIGGGNRLAHAASLAVAELPGQAYNPLFLHAPPGLGKTHLLHAIGNYITAFGGSTRLRYTTVESFTNHFLTALGSRTLDAFKQAYRNADVLLIDDVQFLASKAKTEEEFFHTFNALYETGRQLVLTCDRLPRALVGIEERLRERFEAGLVADIAPPDFSTRLAILRKRAMLDHIPLADHSILELIAERVTDNIRTLEGALVRVVAYHSLTGKPIDRGLTTTVLNTMYPQSSTRVGIGRIQALVAARYELSVSELQGPSRAAKIVWPRQLAIYLARQITDTPLQAIGEAFGHRNHATILHAYKKVLERIQTDSQASADVSELTAAIAAQDDDRPR
jgi:chromosomal replication initiator protein